MAKSEQTFYSEASAAQKVDALKKACEHHVKLTKECSQGLGQDRSVFPFKAFIIMRNS
jgi:carnitine O-acetyltransferase